MFITAMVFNFIAAIFFLIAFVFIMKENVRRALAFIVLAFLMNSSSAFCRSAGLDTQKNIVCSEQK